MVEYYKFTYSEGGGNMIRSFSIRQKNKRLFELQKDICTIKFIILRTKKESIDVLNSITQYVNEIDDSNMLEINNSMIDNLKSNVESIFSKLEMICSFVDKTKIVKICNYINEEFRLIREDDISEDEKYEEYVGIFLQLEGDVNKVVDLNFQYDLVKLMTNFNNVENMCTTLSYTLSDTKQLINTKVIADFYSKKSYSNSNKQESELSQYALVY